jgi:hypothetical protein
MTALLKVLWPQSAILVFPAHPLNRVPAGMQQFALLALGPLAVAAGLVGGVLLASGLSRAPDRSAEAQSLGLPGGVSSSNLWNILVQAPSPSTERATERPVVPRAASTANLRTGPGQRHPVLGTLPAEAPLTIVGRDEEGEWVAIEFPPGSAFIAWIAVEDLAGLDEVESLRVYEGTTGR